MTAEAAREYAENTQGDDILTELRAIRRVLERIEPLIPAMEHAAKFLDNPVQRYREHMKGRRNGAA